jgi:DNA-binding response OmpR family regulator
VNAHAGQRVLVVEDDPDLFDALAAALDAAGYQVELARDGSEALAVLDRFQPDVLITDLVMAGMSGEELIRAVRQRGGVQPRVVVVSGLDAVTARCAALGADACLRKPLDLEMLLREVAGATAPPPRP